MIQLTARAAVVAVLISVWLTWLGWEKNAHECKCPCEASQ